MQNKKWLSLAIIFTFFFTSFTAIKLYSSLFNSFDVVEINLNSLKIAKRNLLSLKLKVKEPAAIELGLRNEFKRKSVSSYSKVEAQNWSYLYKSITLPVERKEVVKPVVAKVVQKKKIPVKNFDRISVQKSAPEKSVEKSVVIKNIPKKINKIGESYFRVKDYIAEKKSIDFKLEKISYRPFFKKPLIIPSLFKTKVTHTLIRTEDLKSHQYVKPVPVVVKRIGISKEVQKLNKVNPVIVNKSPVIKISDEYSIVNIHVEKKKEKPAVNKSISIAEVVKLPNKNSQQMTSENKQLAGVEKNVVLVEKVESVVKEEPKIVINNEEYPKYKIMSENKYTYPSQDELIKEGVIGMNTQPNVDKQYEIVETPKKHKDEVTTVQAKTVSALPVEAKNNFKMVAAEQSKKTFKPKINNYLLADNKPNKATPPQSEIHDPLIDAKSFMPEMPKKEVKKPEVKEYLKDNVKNIKRKILAELILEPLVISGKKQNNNIGEFQLKYEYSDAVIFDGNNSLILEEEIASEIAIVRGTILSSMIIPTTTELVFEDGSVHTKLYTFTRDYMYQIVNRFNLNDDGAYLLVKLDDNTEDVDLDSDTEYSGKLYLDKDYRVVDRSESEYSFVLFIGVRPGNAIISFRTLDNEVTSKIIHLKHGEIYTELNYYVDETKDRFTLLEEKPLSKNPISLNATTDKLDPFSYRTNITKESIDTYGINRALYPLGTRKYFAFENDIIFGRWTEENIVLPSSGYIHNVYDEFNIDGLNGGCLIQVNLSKTPKSLSYTGYSDKGPMIFDFKSLDLDGEFYDEVGIETTKLFFLGNEVDTYGMINMRVDYNDGSSDIIQSFCSVNSYMVEQL
jgi:hypothetical protein